MIKVRLLLCVCVCALLVAALAEGQRQRFNAGAFFRKEAPQKDFAIARWYSSGWYGDGWSHDYPTSEEHILQILKEVTLIDTDRLSYIIVDLSSPDIFKYPFAYVSHPGEVVPSEQEIANIREYVERGGFIMLDDFGGQGQGPEEMEMFLDILRRAFPGREMYRLTDNHDLLRISYEIDNLQMEHPMSRAKSTFYGFDDSEGRLAMIICYANDVGDYWEFLDQPRYALRPSAEATKLGVNIAIYSLTH